jgi:DNA (cytosine-5)-methyltransferase 1
MTAYYNENNPEAAAWLRELIKIGVIADGIVDDRSIVDVHPEDVRGFSQCHWFAGVGGWSYALRLAGISDDQPIWTASLPCQPFSSAGKQLGKDDERHLLPTYINLVEVCRPPIQIGEQVSDAIRHGWLDDLYAEMEARNYAVGSVIAGAHSVGAPHQRQRLYWVAHASSQGLQEQFWGWKQSTETSATSSMGYAKSNNKFRNWQSEESDGRQSEVGRPGLFSVATRHRNPTNAAGWHDPEWIYCRDNKYRPIKPGLKPLVRTSKPGAIEMVNGLSSGVVRGGDNGESVNAEETTEARVMRLKGYGNAIVPQLAAEFIKAFFGIEAA